MRFELPEWLSSLPWTPWEGPVSLWQFVAEWLLTGLAPILVLWSVALWLRRRHLRSLDERELAAGRPLLSTLKGIPPGYGDPVLALGNVVVSHARVRTLAITWRRIVGGRVPLLADLIERARREALLRLEEDAAERGATLVVNLRFSTFAIGMSDGGGKAVEIVASGTAVRRV